MPTLNKYAHQEGYYIRVFIGTMSTLQTTKEAIRRIQQAIRKDTGTFSKTLLQELREEGLVYPKGEYSLQDQTRVYVYPSENQILGHASITLRCRVDQDKNNWELGVYIPEIPQPWIMPHIHLTDALETWSIVIDDNICVPARRLWPGQGGYFQPILPKTRDFSIHLKGKWPPEWNSKIENWAGSSLSALSTKCSFFQAETGEHISSNSPLSLGESYIVVAVSGKSIPPIIKKEILRPNNHYNAWVVCFPEQLNESLDVWVASNGYSIKDPNFTISLATIPVAYDRELDIPIVEIESSIVLAVSPKKKAVTPDNLPIFYKTQFNTTGIFRLSLADREEQISLKVVKKNSLPQQRLDALTFSIGDGQQLHAFTDGSGPHTYTIGEGLTGDLISCAIPVNLEWDLGQEQGYKHHQHVVDANNFIREKISIALQEYNLLQITIDAGGFGRLTINLHPPYRSMVPGDFPQHIVHKARWVAGILSTIYEGPSILLPNPLKMTLEDISAIAGCTSLRYVQRVPLFLLPHIKQLMDSVSVLKKA